MQKFDLVHRDLKPANLMLRKVKNCHSEKVSEETLGDYYQLVIIDLGLSANTNKVTTKSKNFMEDRSGTIGYLAPENWKKTVDTKSKKLDIFSIGVILLEMLTRRNPFTTKSYTQSVRNNYEANINDDLLELMKEGVSSDCIKFIKALCLRDPKMRPSINKALENDIYTRVYEKYDEKKIKIASRLTLLKNEKPSFAEFPQHLTLVGFENPF